MKILVVGDLQILCEDSGGIRAEQTRGTLSWVLGVLDQYKPDAMVHLGDYGEDNRGVDHYSLTLMTWFMSETFKRVEKSWWLVGNHDFCTEDGSVNLMTALQPLMPENHHVPWPWSTGPEGTMFVSYLNKDGKENFRVESGMVFAEKEKTVLFSHLPVNGAMFSPHRFEEGGIDPTWLPHQTIVGHYHRPNPPDPALAAFGNAIWYAGSPMSHDFRDNCYDLTPAQQLRGIWLFDIEKGEVVAPPVFIENPAAVYYLSFAADLDAAGVVQDDWFTKHCVLPLDRTVLKLTVPPGKEEQATAIFDQTTKASTILRSDQHVSATVEESVQVINPDATPAQAVTEYVAGLPPEKLSGLDPAVLEKTGVDLVQDGYSLPEGAADGC